MFVLVSPEFNAGPELLLSTGPHPLNYNRACAQGSEPRSGLEPVCGAAREIDYRYTRYAYTCIRKRIRYCSKNENQVFGHVTHQPRTQHPLR